MLHGQSTTVAKPPACALEQSRFCIQVDPAPRARLIRAAHIETIPADKVLWHDDAPCRTVGLLVSGYLRFQRHNRDGRRQILNLTVPGDLFGHEDERNEGFSLESATEAVLCRFDRRVFDELLIEDGSLRRALYRYGSRNLDRLHWLTWTIGALRPEERIAAFLLNARGFLPYRDLPDGTGLISLAISRRDIADLLATSVETICRTFKSLGKDGLIRLLDPAHVLFLDPAGLAARAGLPDREHAPVMASDPAVMTFINDRPGVHR
ncbi:CRP-like cAMP-binding protein [Rhodovulum marinum]|uniref:CRP-like cAMP-binding protein n=2 Tax=Rhodovulum marinum TaxID=320662 RepID=A0A4R2PX86_9RHOB|nr:CRP-like cAMP-binding protein [Rhodovulum marinum]